MANLSKYAKQRIVSLKESGLTSREVVEALKREGATVIRVTTQVVRRCHKRYLQTGSIDLAHQCPSEHHRRCNAS